MYFLCMGTDSLHPLPAVYLFHRAVNPGDIDGDGYPGEYKGDQHRPCHDFTAQQADYQSDAG